MNAMEQLLYDEVTHFIDRLATSVEPGAAVPTGIRARLADAECELAGARAAMIESYGRWRRGGHARPKSRASRLRRWPPDADGSAR
jgi:hypothetical protein